MNSLPKRPAPEMLDHFVQGRILGAHLVTSEGQKVIRQEVAIWKPEILVLDPWQSFIPGFDENSFKDMSRATEFLNAIIAEFSVTVFIPIHLGKDRSKGARGHSTLAGWRDTSIRLTPNKDKTVTVDVRPRWAQAPGKFKLLFRDGTVYSHCYTPQTEKVRSLVQEAQAITFGMPVLKELLRKHFAELKEDAFRQMLKRAKDDGAIILPDDKHVDLPADESE